ncbi:MAG: ABC transporter ATP-binding protein [Victivallales bacterium]|jgi:ABC transporter related protein
MYKMLWGKYRDRHAIETYCGFYSAYKWKLVFVVFMYLIKSSPMYIIPIITADVINLIAGTPPGGVPEVLKLLVFGSVIILQNIPTHIIYARAFSSVSRQVERNLRTALCTRLQHLSMHYHNSNKMGVLQTKVLRDVENVEMLTRMLVDNLPQIAATMCVAITVTAIRAPLFIIFYLILVPIAVILFRLIRKSMAQRNREFRLSVEDMSGHVSEMLRLIPVTRAHHLEERELSRVGERLEKIRETGFRLDSLNAVFNSVNWSMIMVFNLLTLCCAAYLYMKGILKVGIGDVTLLAGYFNIISGAVMQLLNFLPAMTKGLESVKSIGEVLECPDIEQNEGGKTVNAVRGEFEFRNVSFRYDPDAEYALRDFSLHVKPGETIALVGASGAGKSTVAQLVIGFIRPTEGTILLDGVDMNGLDLRTYRRFISVVTQETILFDGSIRDNIAYGIPDAKDRDIFRAVKFASLEPLINSLPEGLDTRIKENGSRLSGGQRQRIAIARALMRDPRVLILDEATSALDVDSESEIKAALEQLMKGRTSFVVAHRLSTIQNADRIVVLGGGRILEIGTHPELIARNGRYAEMYRKFTMLN